jgi:hypothetical protein
MTWPGRHASGGRPLSARKAERSDDHEGTGKDADPIFVDQETGLPLDEEHAVFLPDPAADDQLRAVLARRAATNRAS